MLEGHAGFGFHYNTMAKIFPFRGFHYNTEIIQNISEVITPPYDNIPEGDEAKYLSRSPYNFAHVDLPRVPGDDYTHASETLTKWNTHRILVGDRTPCFYWYRQTFTFDAHKHVRDALVCSVGLADFAEKVVRPHENTHGLPKKDRLQLLAKTGYNLSHIFAMVKDPEGFLSSLLEKWEFREPLLHGSTDDGAEHSVWKLEAEKVPELAAFFENQPLYIVDGHHRYESALAYAREVGALGNFQHPASKALFSISNAFDPGLIVLPTHRGVRSLGESKAKLQTLSTHYHLAPATEADLKAFTSKTGTTPTFILGFDNQLFSCTPHHWEDHEKTMGSALYKLPMHWSDRKLLTEELGVPEKDYASRIRYEKDPFKLWESRQSFDLLIFHARPKITDVTDVADESRFMPPKSTHFYPKLASGLVLRSVKDRA